MNKPISITLGGMEERARLLIESGRYASMSEVMRAGLRALEREEEALNRLLKAKVEEALADDRPALSLDEAMAKVRAARQYPSP